MGFRWEIADVIRTNVNPVSGGEPRLLTFGKFELSEEGILLEAGVELAIAPKPLALLEILLRRRPHFVTREEVIDEIWAGAYVSDPAFASVVRDLRRALGDNAREPRLIETRRGYGIRFIHAVSERAPNTLSVGSRWSELATHFERALEALDTLHTSRAGGDTSASPRQRGSFLVALARARWGAGATDEARAAFADALDLARDLGDAEVFSHAALGFAGRSDASLTPNRSSIELLEEALRMLGEAHPVLRSEVLARLGTEIVHDDDGTRALELTREAVHVAESTGGPSSIAYALTAQHYVMGSPQYDPRERRLVADRAIEVVEAEGASDVLALALQERLADLMALGDSEEFAETFRKYDRVVTELDQPFFAFMRSLLGVSRLVLDGQLEAAEISVSETLALGHAVRSDNTEIAHLGLLFGIREAQGRLAELAPIVDLVVQSGLDLPILRAAEIAILDAVGKRKECSERLRTLMPELLEGARDEMWMGAVGLVAPLTSVFGDRETARRLCHVLAPLAGRMIVAGHGALVMGSVDHVLGGLLLTLGERPEALKSLEAGLEIHQRANAPIWIARSHAALADVR